MQFVPWAKKLESLFVEPQREYFLKPPGHSKDGDTVLEFIDIIFVLSHVGEDLCGRSRNKRPNVCFGFLKVRWPVHQQLV